MPGPVVCSGAVLQCSFGLAPSTLTVLPIGRATTGGSPVANAQDRVAFLNIKPFTLCATTANPVVAAATTAALGVLTPAPCVPVIPAPWTGTAAGVVVGGSPAVTATSRCQCSYGGVISVVVPGQLSVSSAK